MASGYTSYSLAFPTIYGPLDFPYWSGALVGCWLTPTLNRFCARRGTMLAGSIGTFIAAVPPLCLVPGHLPVTIASSITILKGMSMGVTSCTSLIYLAEISSSNARGRILARVWLMYAPPFRRSLYPHLSPSLTAVQGNVYGIFDSMSGPGPYGPHSAHPSHTVVLCT